jgi:hypothetical protein
MGRVGSLCPPSGGVTMKFPWATSCPPYETVKIDSGGYPAEQRIVLQTGQAQGNTLTLSLNTGRTIQLGFITDRIDG